MYLPVKHDRVNQTVELELVLKVWEIFKFEILTKSKKFKLIDQTIQ